MVKTETLVTTYLQMLSPLEMQSASPSRTGTSESRNKDLEVRELTESDWKFNREMYFRVGEKWKWIDKRPWTDAQWQEYANDPDLRTFAGYVGNEVAGYFELKRTEIGEHPASPKLRRDKGEAIEIAYFGLLPEFIGRGLGAELLGSAVETAWSWTPAPSRVWVHTCNRDHPSALANYQARGFRIYKVESEAD